MSALLPEAWIVSTGAANLASIRAALRRQGVRARVAESAEPVRDERLVVLPGVGRFGPAMECLRRDGLADALRDRVLAGGPMLTVCLGLQLLCDSSEESPETPGLGLLAARAEAFRDVPRSPLVGWNRLDAAPDCELLTSGTAYFVHGYRLTDVPQGWTAATSSYGGEYVAALERGPVLACQFHPEISGRWGRDLLSRWLDRGLST